VTLVTDKNKENYDVTNVHFRSCMFFSRNQPLFSKKWM